MFLGHFGVGFGAKKAAPQVSLGSLFLAAQFVDLLWPSLLLLGVEEVHITSGSAPGPPLEFVSYPFSHSLLAVIVWGLLFAAVYYLLRRSRIGALVLGLTVISHWLLDLVVHQPDLPFYPGSSKAGFGLWSFPAASMALEIAIFAVGLRLYLRSTKAIDRIGVWALWGLAAFLLVIHLSNSFGPPPPSVAAVAWVGQSQGLLILWGYWVDRHRRPSSPTFAGAVCE